MGIKATWAVAAICLALAFAAQSGMADTFKWKDPTASGNWSDQANWLQDSGSGFGDATQLPGDADTVIFDRDGGVKGNTYTVTLTESVHVERMEVYGVGDLAAWRWYDGGGGWKLTVDDEILYKAYGQDGNVDPHVGTFDVILAGTAGLTMDDTVGKNQRLYLNKANEYSGVTTLTGDGTKPSWRRAQLFLANSTQATSQINYEAGGWLTLSVDGIATPLEMYAGAEMQGNATGARTFNGAITLLGDVKIYTDSVAANNLTLTGGITGQHVLTLACKSKTYLQSQTLDVAKIQVLPQGTSGTVYSTVVLDVNADWNLANDWSGRGIVQIGPSANRTLTITDGVVEPLDTGNTARQKPTLQFAGNVVFAASAGVPELLIHVYDGGASPPVAGTDYEQLEVTGTVAGIGAATLTVDFGAATADLFEASDEFVLISAPSQDFSTVMFADVHFLGDNGLIGTLDYRNGAVVLTNVRVPEPATIALLALGAMPLLRRRRK